MQHGGVVRVIESRACDIVPLTQAAWCAGTRSPVHQTAASGLPPQSPTSRTRPSTPLAEIPAVAQASVSKMSALTVASTSAGSSATASADENAAKSTAKSGRAAGSSKLAAMSTVSFAVLAAVSGPGVWLGRGQTGPEA